jgi:hypothetical protein
VKSTHNKATYTAIQEVRSGLIRVDFTTSGGELIHLGPKAE